MSVRRRRRLLLWSALPVLLALALAAKLLSAAWFAGQASGAFARGDAPAVESAAAVLGVANFLEPHKAPFAAGDALALSGDYAGARTAFEAALAAAPAADECRVRVNLALSIERLGDADAGRRHGGTAALPARTAPTRASVCWRRPWPWSRPRPPAASTQTAPTAPTARRRGCRPPGSGWQKKSSGCATGPDPANHRIRESGTESGPEGEGGAEPGEPIRVAAGAAPGVRKVRAAGAQPGPGAGRVSQRRPAPAAHGQALVTLRAKNILFPDEICRKAAS